MKRVCNGLPLPLGSALFAGSEVSVNVRYGNAGSDGMGVGRISVGREDRSRAVVPVLLPKGC